MKLLRQCLKLEQGNERGQIHPKDGLQISPRLPTHKMLLQLPVRFRTFKQGPYYGRKQVMSQYQSKRALPRMLFMFLSLRPRMSQYTIQIRR